MGQGGLYEHEALKYFNMDFRNVYQWQEFLIFNYFGNEVKQTRHVAREVTIKLMTIFIGVKIIVCVFRVLLSIDMLRSGTNPVVALQLIIEMGELG